MKTSSVSSAVGLVIVLLALGLGTAIADIQVLLSVKFIKNWDGTRPSALPGEGGNEIGTPDAFATAVTLGNQVLASTWRGYQLVVVEYLDIQPPAPSAQATDYWFNLPARSNRQNIENAAIADMATWRWNPNAINIYVNNSSSGQCSFVGEGGAITLGDPIFGLGTLLHEVGHVFNLRHTHAGDSDCSGGTNPLADGDGIPETIPDDLCRNRDGLSQGWYSRNYAALTPVEQDFVNTSWLNVMSYHQEEQFLPVQMDYWALSANGPRLGFCTGKMWFVANDGSDSILFGLGDHPWFPFATISRALASVITVNDVVLLRNGSFDAPPGGVISTPCTLRASGGPVTVHKP